MPFVILCTVALIKFVRENIIPGFKTRQDTEGRIIYYSINGAIYAYLLLALVLFIMFYPIIAGIPFNINYIKTFLKWFPTWYFA